MEDDRVLSQDRIVFLDVIGLQIFEVVPFVSDLLGQIDLLFDRAFLSAQIFLGDLHLKDKLSEPLFAKLVVLHLKKHSI